MSLAKEKMETWDATLNFSTDEQVVGTWIDGKPIYQKTFVIANPTNAARNSVSGLDATTIDLIDMRSTAYSSKQGFRINENYYDAVSFFHVSFGGDGKSLYARWGTGDYGTLTDIWTTVTYTKKD